MAAMLTSLEEQDPSEFRNTVDPDATIRLDIGGIDILDTLMIGLTVEKQ
jgi:hypothetical protein